MKFSLWNFKDWYSSRGIDLSYMITDNTASITMISSGSHAAGDQSSCGIVSPGQDFPDCSGFRTVLSFENGRILFPVASVSEVLDLGNEMISVYTGFETRLLDSVISGTGIPEILALCQEHFPFPLAVFDQKRHLEYKTGDWKLPLHGEIRKALQKNTGRDSSHSQPVFSTLLLHRPYTCISFPIVYGRGEPAVLSAYEAEKKLQPGDLHMFQTIAEILEIALRFRLEAPSLVHPLASWFRQVLEDPSLLNPEHAELRFSELDWKWKDYYQITVIQPAADGAGDFGRGHAFYLSDRNCCKIDTLDGIIILVRLGSEYPDSLSAVHPAIQEGFPEGQVHMGTSLPFRDFSLLQYYYHQALSACKKAKLQNLYSLSTSDHLSENILEICSRIPEMHAYLSPDFLKLMQEEEKTREPLVHILYTYLISGCSVSQTADLLFIHRNTLRRYLKKIQTIVHMDPDLPEVCEKLLLSALFCVHSRL